VCVCLLPLPTEWGGTEWGGGNVSCTVCLSVCLFVNSITEKLMVVFCKILEVDIFLGFREELVKFCHIIFVRTCLLHFEKFMLNIM